MRERERALPISNEIAHLLGDARGADERDVTARAFPFREMEEEEVRDAVTQKHIGASRETKRGDAELSIHPRDE